MSAVVFQFSGERVNLDMFIKITQNKKFSNFQMRESIYFQKNIKKEVFQFADERVKGMAVSRKIGAALDSFSAWTLELQNVDYRLFSRLF